MSELGISLIVFGASFMGGLIFLVPAPRDDSINEPLKLSEW